METRVSLKYFVKGFGFELQQLIRILADLSGDGWLKISSGWFKAYGWASHLRKFDHDNLLNVQSELLVRTCVNLHTLNTNVTFSYK